MAYTLKSTGIATNLVMCLAIDSDGATITEFVNSTVNSQKTVDGPVTVGSSTWKGTSRGYFVTSANGSSDFYGIRFGATKPVVDLGVGTSSSFFIAAAGMSSAVLSVYGVIMGTDTYLPLTRNALNATTTGPLGSQDNNVGLTNMPTDNSTKFSVGHVHNWGATDRFFYGLESGSLATDGTPTDSGHGNNGQNILYVGGYPTYGSQPAKYHIVAVFNRELTTLEFQSLHGDGTNDWFSTLFNAPGGGDILFAQSIF